MRFEKSFKLNKHDVNNSNDQWLLCKEQAWFNMADILHALMLNWKDINYSEKLVTERLSQNTNDFFNI
jgi:hypothetical protein